MRNLVVIGIRTVVMIKVQNTTALSTERNQSRFYASFLFFMIFIRENSSRSFSSKNSVMYAMLRLYWGITIFLRAFARFWVLRMAIASL